jgi:CheY-like chemotaxis protein
MFAQVNRTLDRSQGGLGIGLALVKRLVELHGGTIIAESAGLGAGSTFTVRLPFVELCAASGESGPSGVARSARHSANLGRRVLVVDDNIDAAVSLAKILKLSGHDARTAHTGPDALEAALAFIPDVVFLDIGLPGMDGHEVAKRIRNEPALRRSVLVALTGWGSEQDKQQSREAGFDFHLTKPVEVAAVESILAQ